MSKIIATAYGLSHPKISNAGDSFSNIDMYKSDGIFNMINDDTLDSHLALLVDDDKLRRLNRITKMLLFASVCCMRNLDIQFDENDRKHVGLVMNSRYGGNIASTREFMETAFVNGVKNASPIVFPYTVPNAATGISTIDLNVYGFNSTISGFSSLGYSFELIKLGKAKGLFVGGFDEMTNEIKQLIETKYENKGQDISFSEGAAVIFLANNELVEKYGLEQLFEIIGFETITNTDFDEEPYSPLAINRDLISKLVNNILSENNITINEIELISSISFKNSDQETEELEALKSIFTKLPIIAYNKQKFGDSLSFNDIINSILAYKQLNASNTSKYSLILSNELDRIISALLIKI